MMREDESFDHLVREKLNSREFRPSAERREKAMLAIQSRNAERVFRLRMGIVFAIVFISTAVLLGTYFIDGNNKAQASVEVNGTKTAEVSSTNTPNQNEVSSVSDVRNQNDAEKNGGNSTEKNNLKGSVNNSAIVTDQNSTQNNTSAVKDNSGINNSKNAFAGKIKGEKASSPENTNHSGQKWNKDKTSSVTNSSVADSKNNNAQKNNFPVTASKNAVSKSDDSQSGKKAGLVKNTDEKTALNSSSDHSAEGNRDSQTRTGTEYVDSVKMKSYHTVYADDSTPMNSYHTIYADDSTRMNSYHTVYSDDSVKMKNYHTEYSGDSSSNNTVETNAAPNNHPAAVNYFFLEAGATFIPGFSPGFTSGRSINPVIGAGYCFRIGMKTGFQVGLHYTFIGNASDSSLVYTNTSYGFSAQVVYTDVNLKRLHYASLPLTCLYHFNSKNAVNAGLNFNYLFTTETHLHSYSASESNIQSSSKFGYIQGVNRFDLQVAAGYTRTFGSQWSAGISVYSGLMDVKKNSWYGVNKFERNKGLQLMLQYAF